MNFLARLAALPFRPAVLLGRNAVFVRHVAIGLGGSKFGFVFTFVNIALLLALILTVTAGLNEYSFRELMQVKGMGAFLSFINNCVTYGLLAVLIPLRVAGVFDSARSDGSFDQIVATGVRPGKIHRGNWAAAMAYTASILIATLPYQAFAYACEGVGVATLAAEYGILFVYAGVMALVSMALCVLTIEWIAVIQSIVIFSIAGYLALFPLPSVFAHATPIRLLAERGFQAFEAAAGGPAGLFAMYGPPVLFGHEIPDLLYAAILWSLLAGGALITLALGPDHLFVPGLNNFGNVVLPGDRKRSRLRTLRYQLNRRVEMAFFYENRPRFWAGLDWALRHAVLLGAAAIWCTLTMGVLDSRAAGWGRHELQGYVLGMTSIALVFILLTDLESKERIYAVERLGRWPIRRGFLSLLHVVVALCGTCAFTGWVIDSLQGETEFMERFGIVALSAANFYLLGRLLARCSRTPGGTRGIFLLVTVIILTAPLVVFPLYSENVIRSQAFRFTAFLSPFAALMASFSGIDSFFFREMGPDGVFFFYTIHFALLAVLSAWLLALNSLRRARRRAELGSGGAPACAVAAAAGLAAFLVVSGPAAGAEVSAEVVRGFQGVVATEMVEHFTVTLGRGEGETGDAEAEIRLQGPDGTVYVPPRKVDIPPGAKSVLRLAVDRDRTSVLGFYAPLELVVRSGSSVKRIHVAEARHVGQDQASFLLVSEGGKVPSLVSGGHVWLGCDPRYLPERCEAYAGMNAVLVGHTDLSLWTSGQRRALLDFVRAGGTVVFFGPIDERTLSSAPEWSEILAPAESPRTEVDGVSFRIHPLRGGEVVWTAGDRNLPILHLKRIGPGVAGHLSFDLLAGEPPANLGERGSFWRSLIGARGSFWEQLAAKIPGSLPASIPWSAPFFHRWSDGGGGRSLLAVGAYFLGYTIFMGPAMFILFRTRRRRGWVWAYAPAVSLLFVLASPLLFLVMQMDPSEAREVTFLFLDRQGRGGIRHTWLQVESSGRQRHEVAIGGDNVTAFSVVLDERRRYGWNSNEPVRSRLLGVFDGKGPVKIPELHTPPWGNAGMSIISDTASTPRRRVRGTAIPARATGKTKGEIESVKYEVEGLSAEMRAAIVFFLPKREGGPFYFSAGNITSWVEQKGGRVRGTLAARNNGQWGMNLSTGSLNTYFHSRPLERLRAFVLWEERLGEQIVTSEDFFFHPKDGRTLICAQELDVGEETEE